MKQLQNKTIQMKNNGRQLLKRRKLEIKMLGRE
jgi:hypothetical protein